jgi:hypothetical protein
MPLLGGLLQKKRRVILAGQIPTDCKRVEDICE